VNGSASGAPELRTASMMNTARCATRKVMAGKVECDICHEVIQSWHAREEWGRSPWGDGDGLAHKSCADDWEPSDEQLEDSRNRAYPTLAERQDAARRLK
jgi:hypothetical protein